MKSSGKIAVIGDKDVVLVFKTLGIDVFPCTETQRIKATISSLIEKEYSIIMITDKEAEKVEDVISKTKKQTYPIFLPIPDGFSEGSFGMKKMNENTEKVIGKEGKKE